MMKIFRLFKQASSPGDATPTTRTTPTARTARTTPTARTARTTPTARTARAARIREVCGEVARCCLILCAMFLGCTVKPSNRGEDPAVDLHGALNGERYRVLVSSDIGGTDPDDNQSMTHLMMYSDLFDLEGLVSSPSYGAGSKEEILRMIDLYEQDYPRLVAHAPGLMTPDNLRTLCKQGRRGGAPLAGYGEPTEGSEWIVTCARRDDRRPLYVLVWGALEDVAQALHDAPDIADHLRIYWIGGPNKKWGVNAYAYLAENFPNLWFIENNATYRGIITDNRRQEYIEEFDARQGGQAAGGLQPPTGASSQSSSDGSLQPSSPSNQQPSSTGSHRAQLAIAPATLPPDALGTGYYDFAIRGAGALGADFINYYKGLVKMGDTPSLLYMMRGEPANPTTNSWGGRFVKFDHSSRYVFHRQLTAQDTVAAYGIFEIWMEGPLQPDMPVGTPCLTLTTAKQDWDGYYMGPADASVPDASTPSDGPMVTDPVGSGSDASAAKNVVGSNGVAASSADAVGAGSNSDAAASGAGNSSAAKGLYLVRYCPKEPVTQTYVITSPIPGLAAEGAFTAIAGWPGAPQATDYPLGRHWYTDCPQPELYDGDRWQGVQTQLRWRVDILMDWAKRWAWLRE